MFEVLPASAAALAGRDWGSRFTAVAVHAVLIGLAVRFSDGVAVTPPYQAHDTILLAPGPQPEPRPALPEGGRGSHQLSTPPILAPIDVPTTIPPVIEGSFVPPGIPDPGLAIGFDSLRLIGDPVVTPGGSPIEAAVADEAPRLLDHPPVRFPELLRQAGVEGRVMVEAVLDTAGRVEPASVRVVREGQPLFDAEARAVVLGSRYQAARLGGRAVRVRIHVPVAFSLRP